MADQVFVLTASNVLTPMARVGFKSEDIFQALLADHPEILGGTEAGIPLLVSREQGIAETMDGGDRWSIDHLYLDTNAVPILVEVKRATDTRARREVVAQMLDYAAHAVSSWSLNKIRLAFAATCEARNEKPDEVLGNFLPAEMLADDFWKAVEANLRSGRIRMLFVADEIPRELRRIIEFLNDQMRPAEVLGIEVEHYEGADGSRTLVPKTIGVTERASSVKSVVERPNVSTNEEWISRLRESFGEETANGAMKAIQLFASLGCDVGMTSSRDSLFARVDLGSGRSAWPFFVRYTGGGGVELRLDYLKNNPAFADDSRRRETLDRLMAIKTLHVRSTGNIAGMPSFAASALLDDAAMKPFSEFAGWVVAQVK